MKLNRFIYFLIIAIIAIPSCKQKNKRDKQERVQAIVDSKQDIEKAKIIEKENGNLIQGVFDLSEIEVLSSPDNKLSKSFSTSEKIVDYDISPKGRILAALIGNKNNTSFIIKFWDFNNNIIIDSCIIPKSISIMALTYHPVGDQLFFIGQNRKSYQIYKVKKKERQWEIDTIYTSTQKIKRLVVCPRPFVLDWSDRNDIIGYRIFFAENYEGDLYRIVSITEKGNRKYQVIGPKNTITNGMDLGEELDPSRIVADWSLPLSFHPAGHKLIWQSKDGFNVADYSEICWGESTPLNINEGTITHTPNGLGFIHWEKSKKGIGVYVIPLQKENRQLTEYQFISTPSSTPDGKGIVGLTINNEGLLTLNYLPIDMPLNDVVNAWMFIYSQKDLNLFVKNYGIFRPNMYDQIYSLYESENYYCGGYSKKSPTRPYLVTTDIFWELFGSAYQGLFIVKEQEQAMPNFWKMIEEGNSYLLQQSVNSKWQAVFKALIDFKNKNENNPEVSRIIHETDAYSEILEKDFKYSTLKPLGHYVRNEQSSQYYKAFKYFTNCYLQEPDILEELNQFPETFKSITKKWLNSYKGFIAPSKSSLCLENINTHIPKYVQYPSTEPQIFPLSWGFDNEVFQSTVYNSKAQEKYQVRNNDEFRLLPSGIDLAAVLGNSFAEELLKDDIDKFPPLKKVINNLKRLYQSNKNSTDFENNIYNRWINAIAIQWLDTISSFNRPEHDTIWHAKRIQTGLATWATLRHATILVNATGAAECGEAGFEEILMRTPRGYVEPDPYTFEAIAQLFDYAIEFTKELNKTSTSDKKDLYEGMIKRLEEASQEARNFKLMAQKELKGVVLSDDEYEKILYTARVAEHLFLIFNSFSNDNQGLANPDPIAKIANVAGGRNGIPYLMSAVGNTMEWDWIVPYYGRRQIVKGSIYSYYEFASETLLNDREWRELVTKQEFTSWTKPYISDQDINSMPEMRY
jgi:hypothetical protein